MLIYTVNLMACLHLASLITFALASFANMVILSACYTLPLALIWIIIIKFFQQVFGGVMLNIMLDVV